MTRVTASAPGKVVLSGEYAVLHGAPAVCMAVDRRAIVSVTSVETSWNSVTSAGYTSGEGRFVCRDAEVEWLQGKDDFRLVDAAFQVLDRTADACVSIELDTRAFFDELCNAKIGLGSSAALTVALSAALTQSDDVVDDAMQIHRRFQSGAGSGVDIATAVHGGLLEFRMNGAKISPLGWPKGLAYRLVWTGVPASTESKLSRFEGAGHRRSRDALVNAATRMAAAWRSASEVLGEFPGYIDTLRDFSEDYELGIFDAGHDRLVAESRSAGLIYKPCGAGGGDVGILLGTNDEQLDEFLADNPMSGCRVFESNLETQGVTWGQH
ncbi:MAG: mevalonate kinase family protein [Woeseiaceae bacterium]